VTIATNMAGRGTDIKLGPGVVWVDRATICSQASLETKIEGRTLRDLLIDRPCGLHVIGSERHEARRIDRQLRGRCARQGDPGSSRFYISLEDNLMRLFGSDRIAGIMSRLGLEEGQELEHSWLNRSIERAQRRVEQHNYAIRKRTLEYDDVMNRQREIVYGMRGDIVRRDSAREPILEILEDALAGRIARWRKDGETAALIEWVRTTFPIPVREAELDAHRDDAEGLTALLFERVKRAYTLKMEAEDPETAPFMERSIVLRTIDSHWQDYLRGMDSLRQGVGLRAYGQRDPLIEYKREAYEMFEALMGNVQEEIAGAVFRASTSVHSFESFLQSLPQNMVHDELNLLDQSGVSAAAPAPAQGGGRMPEAAARMMERVLPPAPGRSGGPVRRDAQKVGRNDPCPCGSGKKYKKCCGR
jgi:preprotein translocase subunit SecA